MDVPQPPQDEELRNIIDKLAVFVARNGPDFEQMTKQKQQGNPRFQFLYGGEHFNYYMYRVTTEQAVLNHKAQQMQRPPSAPGNNLNPFGGGGNFSDFPPQQQQQQQQRRFSYDQQQQQMIGQNPPPPRHMSRFDRGPPSGLGNQFQNFERPPMRMPFQQQQQQQPPNFHGQGGFNNEFNNPPAQQGGFDSFEPRRIGQGFDRGSNFDRRPSDPAGSFNDRSHGQSFNDRREQGGFDRGPPPGQNFDRGSPSRNPFETRPQPRSNRFDIGPSGGFESGPQPLLPSPQSFQPNNFQSIQPPQQQQILSTPIIPPPTIPPHQSLASINSEIESVKSQKQILEDQIKQSEQNLAGQQQLLMTQQQKQIDEAILILQDAEIKQLAAELNVDLVELDTILQPIIDSCTKDAISGGKAWIFTHTSTPRHYQLLSMYLLKKTTDPSSSFLRRLHIIYLVNDVLHHCMRKGAEDLRQVLEAMVIPMFAHAKVKEAGNAENISKLDKLLNLWESKCQYVCQAAVEKLRDANGTWVEYHGELLKRHAVVANQIVQNIQKTFEGYQAQHQIFCQHNLQTIKTLEQTQLQLTAQQQQQMSIMSQQQQQPPLIQQLPNIIPPPGIIIPPGSLAPNKPIATTIPVVPHSLPSIPTSSTNFGSGPTNPGFLNDKAIIPPPNQPIEETAATSNNVPIPDISRPPPGFAPPPLLSDKDLMPALPYFELPAGLIVPLVKPEDDNYKPIDPKAIRLPPPCPPSERLIQAVEAFYAAPSHERPRDSEGWERLGLYEYYKTKNLARKQKEDDIREGRREKSKSPSPIRRDSSPSGRSPPRRRYQSKSPTPTKRKRSRSRSPRSTRKGRRRSRSKSRSRSPIRRSPTPPSFGMAGLGMEKKIDESNKGHQLLKKMGWGGTGLGANEQGIEAPISGGEVRERKDLYKGMGVPTNNDPFESYRKSKGQAFVERMRARADDRP